MDADDTFNASKELNLDFNVDGYNIEIKYGNTRFDICRLFRNRWGVHFKGAIHEYPVIDNLRNSNEWESIQYIDLRVENRAYYSL